MNGRDAHKFFDENFRLFSDSDEKSNLYGGLMHLSTAIEQIQNEIHKLRQDIHSLDVKISQM